MGDGFNVNVEQLRAHARHVDAIRARFAAVQAASAHIAQDDQAYGLLCGWISGVLEGRHTRQDELIAHARENLALVATVLQGNADDYEGIDNANADLIRSAEGVVRQ